MLATLIVHSMRSLTKGLAYQSVKYKLFRYFILNIGKEEDEEHAVREHHAPQGAALSKTEEETDVYDTKL